MPMQYTGRPRMDGLGKIGRREKAALLAYGRQLQFEEAVKVFEVEEARTKKLAAKVKYLATQLAAKGVSQAEMEYLMESA